MARRYKFYVLRAREHQLAMEWTPEGLDYTQIGTLTELPVYITILWFGDILGQSQSWLRMMQTDLHEWKLCINCGIFESVTACPKVKILHMSKYVILIRLAKKCSIIHAPKSDHSTVTLRLQSNYLNQTRGPGFCKFNSVWLRDEAYVKTLDINIPVFKKNTSILEEKRKNIVMMINYCTRK